MNTLEELETQENQIAHDATGLVEMQNALREIEKLKQVNEGELQEDINNETILDEDVEENENTDRETAEEDDSSDISSEKSEKEIERLWRLKKRKYQAIAEKEAVLQENAQLKQMLNQSLNSGTYHYGKNAYFDLEKAKESKKKALEEGDTDALIEADINISKALNVVNDLEKWAYNERQNQPRDQEYSYEQEVSQRHSEIQNELINDWLDGHSYLEPTSKNYNPKFAEKVATFVHHLDSNLTKNNNEDAIYSNEYFNTLDQYIENLKEMPKKTVKNLESANHIGGVRNSHSSAGGGKNGSTRQVILTADEKRMCANAGIKETDWLKYKLEDLK